MKYSRLAAVLATIFAVSGVGAQTPAADPSAKLREVLPADVADRVLAKIATARAHDLPPGAAVRFQGTAASELGPGWHRGTVLITSEGCALILTPDSKVPGGRRGLGLVFIQTLERRDGSRGPTCP